MSAWPQLPLGQWADTYATLHRWTQVVGKTRLALAPMQNHWWQVTQYLTSRGLGTSPMPYGERTIEIDFDFFDDLLIARTSEGEVRKLPLAAQSVAEFYRRYLDLLRSLDVNAHIRALPSEIVDPLPFDQDQVHASYDADAVRRWWRALAQADRVLKQFRGAFLGKCSP